MKEKGFFQIQFDEEQGKQPFLGPLLLGKPNHILSQKPHMAFPNSNTREQFQNTQFDSNCLP
jgi:hypothetical protein